MIGERIKAREGAARDASSASAARSAARASATQTFRVSLVGYTNAGKSTLFNALVKARRLRRRPAVRDARHDDAPALPRRASSARCRCPTRSASSATCRTSWSRPSRRRCRRRPMPTCCCTSSTARARVLAEQMRRGRARARRDRRRRHPAGRWSTTSSTGSKTTERPRALRRHASSCAGGVRVPRVFVSALNGEGLDGLRARARAKPSPARRRRLERAPMRPHLRRRRRDSSDDSGRSDEPPHRHHHFTRMTMSHSDLGSPASPHAHPWRCRAGAAARCAGAPRRARRRARRAGAGSATCIWRTAARDGPPDLDELWRDFNRKLSGLFGGKGGGPRAATAAAIRAAARTSSPT